MVGSGESIVRKRCRHPGWPVDSITVCETAQIADAHQPQNRANGRAHVQRSSLLIRLTSSSRRPAQSR